MGQLDKLKITRRALGRPKSRRKVPLVEHIRKKLIANIEEQIQLAKLEMAGKPLELGRRRGRRLVTVRPKLWWDVDPTGQIGTYIIFNKTVLNLVGRGHTIEVKNFADLPKVYETVIRAIRAGELDNELIKIAKGLRRQTL